MASCCKRRAGPCRVSPKRSRVDRFVEAGGATSRMVYEIFEVAEAISESRDVLVCKLVGGKVTYLHRRLWPALVKLAARFRKSQLAKVWNEHTQTGAHRSRLIPFPGLGAPRNETSRRALVRQPSRANPRAAAIARTQGNEESGTVPDTGLTVPDPKLSPRPGCWDSQRLIGTALAVLGIASQP